MDTLLQSKPYRFGAHALIFNKDNYVLLTQDRGYQENEWNFPGGGREANENPAENALREMKEELGLKYDDVEVLGVSSHPIQYDFPQNFIEENLPIVRTYRGQHKDNVYMRLVNHEAEIHLDSTEVKSYIWVHLDEVSNYFVFPNQYKNFKPVLDEYLQKYDKSN